MGGTGHRYRVDTPGLKNTGYEPGLGGVFSGILNGAEFDEQPALPAAPLRPIESLRPLSADERCPKHETPDPECAICKAFARARGERL
jgi:hypothetical protein